MPYTIEQMEASVAQFLDADQTRKPRRERPAAGWTDPGIGSSLSNLGKLTDGREAYMRDTILACFKQFCGENGNAPTANELFDAAWPQYERNVCVHVPGKVTRGTEEFFAKCESTLRRFERGD